MGPGPPFFFFFTPYWHISQKSSHLLTVIFFIVYLLFVCLFNACVNKSFLAWTPEIGTGLLTFVTLMSRAVTRASPRWEAGCSCKIFSFIGKIQQTGPTQPGSMEVLVAATGNTRVAVENNNRDQMKVTKEMSCCPICSEPPQLRHLKELLLVLVSKVKKNIHYLLYKDDNRMQSKSKSSSVSSSLQGSPQWNNLLHLLCPLYPLLWHQLPSCPL